MKKIIIMLSILIVSQSSYAQDILDPQPLTLNDNNNVILNEPDRFILGWNWGSYGQLVDDCLLINTTHEKNWFYGTLFSNNQIAILNIDSIGQGNQMRCYAQVQALQFDPRIEVQTDDANFIPDNNRTPGSIFGFQFRHQNYLSDQVVAPDTNNNWFILRENSHSGNGPELVLDSAWDQSQLVWYNNAGLTAMHQLNSTDEDGTRWYLSLRIKGMEEDITNPDDTILTIRVPYLLHGSTTKSYINFDSIPTSSAQPYYEIIGSRSANDFRGLAMNLDQITTQLSTVAITAGMLDTSRSITISSHFIMDPLLDPYNNPWLKLDKHDENSQLIKDLGVEVYYHGNLDCAIDWIRFETPHSMSYFRGGYDELIRQEVQNAIDSFATQNRGMQIHRIFYNDEIGIQHIYGLRYFNQLCDNIGTTEAGNGGGNRNAFQYPNMYIYHTEAQDFFNGENITFNTTDLVPYYRRTFWNDWQMPGGDWNTDGVHTFNFQVG
jgi:hypothetical protein